MINSRFDFENQQQIEGRYLVGYGPNTIKKKKLSKVKYLFKVFELEAQANEIKETKSLHMIMESNWRQGKLML